MALTNTVALAAGKDTVPYRLASSDCSVGCTLAAPRVLSTMKKGPKTSQRAGEKVKKKKRRKKKKTNTHKINFYCIRISVSHDNGDDVLPFLSFSHCAKVFLFCSRTLGRFSFSSTFATCQRLILAAKVIYILACFHFPIETPTTIPNTAFHTTPHYRYSAEDPRRKLSQIAGSWQFDNKAVS